MEFYGGVLGSTLSTRNTMMVPVSCGDVRKLTHILLSKSLVPFLLLCAQKKKSETLSKIQYEKAQKNIVL